MFFVIVRGMKGAEIRLPEVVTECSPLHMSDNAVLLIHAHRTGEIEALGIEKLLKEKLTAVPWMVKKTVLYPERDGHYSVVIFRKAKFDLYQGNGWAVPQGTICDMNRDDIFMIRGFHQTAEAAILAGERDVGPLTKYLLLGWEKMNFERPLTLKDFHPETRKRAFA